MDGITGAAPKVSGVQPQPVQQTPDFSRLNENQLDAKLHDLGVNPKVYEEMSPAQKAILLNRRVEELGSLAKETPENVAAAQNAENGPVSETQLKNMLARNAERHPGVDMNKVYGQLKAAGIKNPEEAFYKLEQARLLAPNDKIMTVDGTNIRDTFFPRAQRRSAEQSRYGNHQPLGCQRRQYRPLSERCTRAGRHRLFLPAERQNHCQ